VGKREEVGGTCERDFSPPEEEEDNKKKRNERERERVGKKKGTRQPSHS
jgi:hypothetical protein